MKIAAYFNSKITAINLLLVLYGVLPRYLYAQETSLTNFKIVDTKNNKEISLNQLTKKLKKADVIFFGEEHNDSIGHLLEFALLKQLYERYQQIGLSMEMFQSDTQLVLDEYLNDIITEANFRRDGKLWNNYDDYQKLITYAKENKIPVLAANAPSRYTNSVTRNGLQSLGILSDSAKQLIAPLPIDTLTGRYYEKFMALMGNHQAANGMNFYQSQNLWDATMAYRISNFNKQFQIKIVHITGRFHCDEKLGTYQQLQKYAPELKLVNISCFPNDSTESQAQEKEENTTLADFIIYTTPHHQEE
ncbi:hypothetical protein GCM10023231_28180 [Olivibacter ginsenosidimutans]|uniref:Haem-binding uptake Tiki superfamily ChaN domain-containing protein n=1 Tax=Olivibacter ginsenosidimutans TaxID=1176537 RepID=A0ABP9BQT6_9SPHI